MRDTPLYNRLLERRGEAFCREAGYFDESRPFDHPYGEIFDLPRGRTVIQYSGAFHPLHEGHLSALSSAVAFLRRHASDPMVVVHVDHAQYRLSKGHLAPDRFSAAFGLLETLDADWKLVAEDLMPDGCSRNFTRLYAELAAINPEVWFLCGGDRANYALTFIDEGACIVSGRDQEEMYRRHIRLQNDRLVFLPGNHSATSTNLRAGR